MMNREQRRAAFDSGLRAGLAPVLGGEAAPNPYRRHTARARYWQRGLQLATRMMEHRP